jgi:predicted nucleic acid-binding OB-fold protein
MTPEGERHQHPRRRAPEPDREHHDHGHAAYYSSIDINHATIEELQRLPGIGPKLAQRILDARPFYSQEELEYHAHLPQSVIKLIVDRIYFH